MNLLTLREETEQQHNSLEALLPLSDPGLDLPQYQKILQCFYTVVERWESWAVLHAPPRLTALVQERTRLPLLQRDLAFLGLPAVPAGTATPGEETFLGTLAATSLDPAEYEAAFLGAMYVMEGSTLGGQYIARHVEGLFGLAPGEGDAYFRGYGEHTGSMWNAFREILAAVPDRYSSIVIDAARRMFSHLEDTFQSCPAALQTSRGAASGRHAPACPRHPESP